MGQGGGGEGCFSDGRASFLGGGGCPMEVIALVGDIFGINYPLFTQAISKFSKRHSGSLFQIALPNM